MSKELFYCNFFLFPRQKLRRQASVVSIITLAWETKLYDKFTFKSIQATVIGTVYGRRKTSNKREIRRFDLCDNEAIPWYTDMQCNIDPPILLAPMPDPNLAPFASRLDCFLLSFRFSIDVRCYVLDRLKPIIYHAILYISYVGYF